MHRAPAVDEFYNALSPLYDLIYEDWNASIERQTSQLSKIIETEWPGNRRVLDVSCGIGTQAIGLSLAGYSVYASDVSGTAVQRAQQEAIARGANVTFCVCDMRDVFGHHGGQFDVVISVDNSVPHLLSDDDILRAFEQFYACLQPGGGCVITVRDYEREPVRGTVIKPYGERLRHNKRYTLSQTWEFASEQYDLTFSIIEEDTTTRATQTHVFRSRYYAIPTTKLRHLMTRAGFDQVKRLDGVFYQPVLVGTKPE